MTMKPLVFCAAAALAIAVAAPAFAADLPARVYTKAPPVAAVYNWTGFYVGVNGSYIENHSSWDVGPAPFAFDGRNRGTGFFGGAQAGYNYQVGTWVFGVEALGDWGDLNNWYDNVGAGRSNRSRIDSFGLFTGRLGYALNNALFYAKGGGAAVHDKYEVFDTGTLATLGTATETRWGAAAGAGIEVAFSENWSVSAEYVHAFLDHRTLTFNTVPLTTPYNIRQDVDLVAFHLNYSFR
jgi:outer membrane immunogenic protein